VNNKQIFKRNSSVGPMKRGFWVVVKDKIRRVDVVIEVLDARMPDLTRNERLEKYTTNLRKKLILVINKTDLVSKDAIKNIEKRYSNFDYVLVSCKKNAGIGELVKAIKNKKGSKLKVAVIGYPNTGKSSIINKMSKGGKARTSSESGFTKGVQLIAGKRNFMFVDTPGIIPYEDRKETLLGLTSAISPAKLSDPEIVAYELLKMFKRSNPDALKETYELDTRQSTEQILIQFAKQKNMLMKKGIPDERRAAIQLLTDWHKGKIKI